MNAIPTGPLKEKFTNNQESVAQMRELTSMFGARLGEYDIDPDGLASTLALFYVDVDRGIDGFTDEPLPGRFGNAPGALQPMMKRILVVSFVAGLGKYLPEDFAKETQRIFKELTRP